MDEELRDHIDQRVRDNMARGMDRDSAHRAALARLGDLERVRSECTTLLAAERRMKRRRDWLQISWLDVKLGLRMLIKYPGLTVVGGIAIAFAIWVGVSGYEIISQVVRPTLPLHEGDRVVGIRLTRGVRDSEEVRVFNDLLLRGDAMRSVEEIGAFRTVDRNLVVDGDRAEPVKVAEITASGFRLPRVPPLLGRALDASDEAPGAAAALLIGYNEWRDRFDGRPDVVGETVRLGGRQATVVGVMPEGFAFPYAHGFWTPLSRDEFAHGSSSGVDGLQLIGRLASGYDFAEAGAEVALVADRVSAESPSARRALVAEVLPYPGLINDVAAGGPEAALVLVAVNLFLVMLLILACGNVALLMFARAATRENELAVRSALGASRARITMQLFVEALVLAGIAAAAGLMASGVALRSTFRMMTADRGFLPFWFEASLSKEALLYAAVLTVLSAAIAGIVPAVKVAGRDLSGRLRQASGASSRHQFRGIWTVVIVAQVAMTVAFPAMAFFAYRYVAQVRQMEVGFASEEFLAARLELDPVADLGRADSSRAERRHEINSVTGELKRRLSAEPGIAGVTVANRLPRTLHERVRIEVDGVSPAHDGTGIRVGRASVDLDFFNVLEAAVLAGRAFGPADVEARQAPIIVNQAFVDQILKSRSPIGMRVRTLTMRDDGTGSPVIEPSDWYEIVGLVEDLGVLMGDMDTEAGAGFYQPASPGDLDAVWLAIHVSGSRPPESFTPRLRSIASAVDPALRLTNVTPLDEAASSMWLETQFLSRLLMLASGIALLLSVAAIYSVTAFAVASRTREIGIRAALGAHPRRILVVIFLRPLLQVGLGVAVGSILVGLMTSGVLSGSITGRQIGLIALYAVVMLGVCALACVVPTRRALRIPPTEAMRANV